MKGIRVSERDPIRFYSWPVVGSLYRRRMERCLEYLNHGDSVLEIGFGSGVALPYLTWKFSRVFGIDPESEIDAVENKRVHLRNGTVLNLPYVDDSFDAVLAISVLEHLKPYELDTACREIRRVLKPAGQFVYGVPIERKLMVFAFRLLGCKIREHHFSTEQDVFDCASDYFSMEDTETLKALGLIEVYEIVSCQKACL